MVVWSHRYTKKRKRNHIFVISYSNFQMNLKFKVIILHIILFRILHKMLCQWLKLAFFGGGMPSTLKLFPLAAPSLTRVILELKLCVCQFQLRKKKYRYKTYWAAIGHRMLKHLQLHFEFSLTRVFRVQCLAVSGEKSINVSNAMDMWTVKTNSILNMHANELNMKNFCIFQRAFFVLWTSAHCFRCLFMPGARWFKPKTTILQSSNTTLVCFRNISTLNSFQK